MLKTAALLHITRPPSCRTSLGRGASDGWTWFIFPWNRNEDLRTLLPKTLYEEKGEADIQKAFREQFQIDVPLEDIRTTLEDLEAAGTVTRAGEKWTRA